MLMLTRTYKRSNVNTLWHFEVMQPTEEFLLRIQTYKQSGKIIVDQYSVSADFLTVEFFMVFDNETSYSEYDNDIILNNYWEVRKIYNDENGIIMGPKIVTPL